MNINDWKPKVDERFEGSWRAPEITHATPTTYGWTVWRPENFKLGNYVDIGAGTRIFAHYRVEIGDCVQIGGGCLIYSLSTESLDGEHKGGKVVIEDGAQIGAGSIIFQGVTIGRGAFVTAGSLVTRDVAPHTVVSSLPPATEVPKLTAKMRAARGITE